MNRIRRKPRSRRVFP